MSRSAATVKAASPLGELATGSAYVVGLAVILSVFERVVGQNPLALAVSGAVVAELVASRAGVTWSAPHKSFDVSRALSLAGRAGLLAAAAAALVVAAAAALGVADITAGRIDAAIVFAIVRATSTAVRDELLYRGIAFAAAGRAGAPRPVAIAFGAIAGGAAVALLPGATPVGIGLEIAPGLAFALLWSRGAVAAVAAHAAWSFLIGAGFHGEPLDVVWRTGTLASTGRASGAPAWLATAAVVFVVAAVFAIERARKRRAAPPSTSQS